MTFRMHPSRLHFNFLFIFAIYFSAIYFSLPSVLLATPRSQVQEGLSFDKIISKLGAPKEKIEMETTRKSIWKYEGGRIITFQNGRVSNDSLSLSSRNINTTLKKPDYSLVAKESLLRSNNSSHKVSSPLGKNLPFTGSEIFSEMSKIESTPDDPQSSKKTKDNSKNSKKKR